MHEGRKECKSIYTLFMPGTIVVNICISLWALVTFGLIHVCSHVAICYLYVVKIQSACLNWLGIHSLRNIIR